MNDTPPRIPPGWQKAAATFVWRDWLACLSGNPRPALVNGWGADSVSKVPGLRLNPIQVTFVSYDLGEMYAPSWATPEARLRAWAAVGAPVIPPEDEGRHSMAEWFSAAQSSSLGPSTHFFAHGDGEMMLRWSTPAKDIAEAFLTITRQCTVEAFGAAEVVVSTPASMVVELDRIASARAWER